MRLSRVIAVLGIMVLVAAGCSDDDESDVASEGTAPPATQDGAEEEDADDDGAEEDGADATVALEESDLGPILVDAEGRTLYLFTNDEPDTSNCADDCAEAWPPLEAPDELVAGDGVDESLLGTIDRDDGSSQVTYASNPLYYYAADSGPGDTNGQGVGGVWYVVGADGEAIEAEAAASAPGY